MRCITLSALVLLSAAAVLSSSGGRNFGSTEEMMDSFAPTQEEIAALRALHTPPPPGAPRPTRGFGPHTIPPAVVAIIEKRKKARAAYHNSMA